MKSKSTYFRVFISVRGPVWPSVFLSVFLPLMSVGIFFYLLRMPGYIQLLNQVKFHHHFIFIL